MNIDALTSARGRDRRRRLDDQAFGIDRGLLSDAGARPCFPGQRALSSRQARAGLAFSARLPDQAAFHSGLLPALEPDRAVVGRHAQARHAQQMLRDMHPIRRRDARFSAGNGSPQLGEPMRFSHRQFPRHIAQGFSGYGVNEV